MDPTSPERFTVFHLNGERGFRGGERQTLYLARELARRGHRNVVVCRRGEELERRARELSLETLPLPFFNEWDPVSAWRLRRALLAARRPILHAHTAHAASLSLLACAGTGALRVVHRRVDFKPGALSLRLKYRSADALIVISQAVRAAMGAALADGPRVETIHSALALDSVPALERGACRAALASRFGLNPARLWIGNLAACVPHKDQATLLRAAARLRARRPEALLLIVGEGPERAGLERLSAELGLGDAARFLGFLPEPFAVLGAMDLFALSSREEGMGTALLDAMAVGIPIAATRAGGIPEVVRDGREALLSPPGDPGALADSLARLAEDPALRERLVAGGRERVREFGVERLGERVERLYRDLSRAR